MKLLNLSLLDHNHIIKKQSEGEEFMQDFFQEVGIRYESEKMITGLRGDTKQYRVADFYLPDYKTYVEFLGLWFTNNYDEYRIKKDIYKLNNIPCVYIYPENLGIIKYSFDKRIQVELINKNLYKELRRYRIFKLKSSGEFQGRVAGIIATSFIIILKGISIQHKNIADYLLLSTFLLVGIYQIFKLSKLYHRIFNKNKFTLDKLDE
jgi:hypothetical protein